jgi:hypothetical protein
MIYQTVLRFFRPMLAVFAVVAPTRAELALERFANLSLEARADRIGA